MPSPLFIAGQKLAALRVEKLLTQSELAVELGMSVSGVRRLEQSLVVAIQLRNFRRLADVTQLTPQQLRSRIGAVDLAVPDSSQLSQPASVGAELRPVEDVQRFHGVSASRSEQRAEVSRGNIPAPISSERRFAAVVDGDCMEPRYRHGDVVVFSIDAAESEGILEGRNYFIQFADGENTFKRLFFDSDDSERLVLQCWNPRYPPRTIERQQIALLARAVYRVIPDE